MKVSEPEGQAWMTGKRRKRHGPEPAADGVRNAARREISPDLAAVTRRETASAGVVAIDSLCCLGTGRWIWARLGNSLYRGRLRSG